MPFCPKSVHGRAPKRSLLYRLGIEQDLLARSQVARTTFYRLTVVLCKLGRAPEAIGHWEQALRLKPDYAEAHYNLGVVLFQQGEVPEAIDVSSCPVSATLADDV